MLGRLALSVFYFGALPIGAALLTVEFLWPTDTGAGPLARPAAALLRDHVLLVLGGLALLYAAVIRAWLDRLPGGARLVRPPRPVQPVSPGLIAAVVLAAGAALFVRSRVVESYRVMSGSMLPALEAGDRIGVDRRAYGLRLAGDLRLGARPPRRGEVIVFQAAGGDAGSGALVKRVIGLPGERIEMQDGHPIIDGWAVPACDAGAFAHFATGRLTRGRVAVEFLEDQAYLTLQEVRTIPFPGYTVKAGEVFVLGDNRGGSNDSRAWTTGVPLGAIEGQARLLLLGTRRDGRPDWRRALRALGHDLAVRELDASAIESGIERCLANRPSETFPPAQRPSNSDAVPNRT